MYSIDETYMIECVAVLRPANVRGYGVKPKWVYEEYM